MNNRKWIISVVLGAVLIFGAGVVAGAATAEPGSEADPLITKSYFDTQIADIKEDGMYELVSVAAGKTLSCTEGSQVIVTSGAAKTTAAAVDITLGESLKKGKKITLNHSYLITVKNGGIKASKTMKVFVNGTYSVK